MRDHRSGRRWRRAIARTNTRFRHVDRDNRISHRAGDHLPESSHVLRGLR